MSDHSGRDTRIRILEAAADRFAAFGFRAATMRQIAAAAKVNDVTVYRYFPKKQQLYWAAIEWKVRSSSFDRIVSANLRQDAGPRELLSELGEHILGAFLQDPNLARLLYFTVLELPEEKKKLYNGHLKPLIAELRTAIECWVRLGIIRAVDPHSASLAIAGLLWSPYTFQELFGVELPKTESIKQLAADFAELCLSGLGASSNYTSVGS